MAKEVGVIFKVHNQMAAGLGSVTRDINKMQSVVSGTVRAMGVLAGGYGLSRAFQNVTRAAMEHETAERKLAAAMALTGDATSANLAALGSYASQLQKQTVYSDEEILSQIAYAKAMGLSTDKIGEATIAAIGLATAYDKDLGAAMKYITLASKGETGQLKEMGIVINQNLSAQGKYNELLRQMTAKYVLAQEATKDATGTQAQLRNEFDDVKRSIGESLLPQYQTAMRSIQNWLSQNQGHVKAWAEYTVDLMGSVGKAAVKMQDQIVSDRADQWITHTARERERIERIGTPEQKAYESQRMMFNEWGLDIMPNRVDERRVAQIEAQLRKENDDLIRTQFKAPPALSGTFDLVPPNLTSSGAAAGDGASALTKEQESARNQVVRLNQALKEQYEAQLLLSQGDQIAAEMVKYKSVVEQAYADDVPAQQAMLTKYESALRQVESIKRDLAASAYLTGMQEEVDVLKLLADGRQAEAEQLRIVNDLKRQGIELTPEETAKVKQLTDEQRKLTAEVNRQQETARSWTQTLTQGIDGVSQALANAVVYGEDLEDNLLRVAQQIAAMVLAQQISSGINSALPASWTTAKGANGMQISQGHVIPFGFGGAVSGPTVFPLASGRTGLVGESGDELIFPAERLGGNKLGVHAVAEKPTVELNVTNSGQEKGVRVSSMRWDAAQRRMVIEAVMEDLDRGGELYHRFR